MKRLVSHSRVDTVALGADYGAGLKPGDVVALIGELGSGKTSFVAGACRAFGLEEQVSSPTFTMINEYRGNRQAVAHVDLYRIDKREELAELGIDEYFAEPWVCFVEWAERAGSLLPPRTRRVTFVHGRSSEERVVTLDPDL